MTPPADGAPAPRPTARGWLAAFALAALVACAFFPVLRWMIERWSYGDSYYSHGFIVPVVAAWFIWRERSELATLYRRDYAGSWLGLAVLIAGWAGLFVSGVLSVYFTAGFSLVLVLWGLGGFLFGRAVMRRLAFPALVLAFGVPLPLETIAGLSLRLKLLSAQWALASMGLFGLSAVNDGSTIYLGNEAASTVVVGDACSGLRSLISLIFLGAVYARLSGLPPGRAWVLFAASLPAALAANVARVFALCTIAYHWGSEAIVGWVHDASGYLIFVAALALLGVAHALLRPRRSWPAAAVPAREGPAHA